MKPDPETVLANFEEWVVRRAAWMTADRELRKDLEQVGRIAIWEACQSFNEMSGSLPSWVTFKARNAMRDHFSTPKWGRVATNEWAFDLFDADWHNLLMDRGASRDMPDMAYHQREIVAAINSLSPRQREYVYLRFFCDYKAPELRQHFGYDPQGLWSSPKNGAKNKLRPQLVHLTRGSE